MQVPGRAGYSIIGDESIEFYRTPRDYLDKRRRNHGNVFLGRILNKPTVFMTSNRAVQDLLRGMRQGYELESLFVIFTSANFVRGAYVPTAKKNITACDQSPQVSFGTWQAMCIVYSVD